MTEKKLPIKLSWTNCFWLIIPLLAWNLVLGAQLSDPRIASDAFSPKWMLVIENLTRLVIFIFPILLPLRWNDALSKTGLAIYLAGILIYFATWLPLLLAPDSAWSNSPAGLLAPWLTPFLPFLGIAMVGHSLPYGVIAIGFIFFHTWHGVQNLPI